MPQDTVTQLVLQVGGLGLAAYVVWWITRKLNGKMDRLTDAIEKLTRRVDTLIQDDVAGTLKGRDR